MSDQNYTISLPEMGLVVLCGASGSGKSTFARQHFIPTEIVSSDHCRALVGDDETDQSVTGAAFGLLHTIIDKRLQLGRLTVVDATNVKPEDRAQLVEIARRWDVLATAIVFDLPVGVCLERNASRVDRRTPDHAIRRQHRNMGRTIKRLKRERFARVHT
ncbi:MAG: AAA family ATPase, partial [Actinomycetia bacterium]|nr:AAA family ATPase [Actinomycetes bacterium]